MSYVVRISNMCLFSGKIPLEFEVMNFLTFAKIVSLDYVKTLNLLVTHFLVVLT